jgi:hypothetical protein
MKFHSAIFSSAAAICVVSCLAFSALAQGVSKEGLPKAGKPEDVGFSSERLKRIAGAFQADVGPYQSLVRNLVYGALIN